MRNIILCIVIVLLQGCAGTRDSYKNLIEKDLATPTIQMVVDETKEVLAVGDGFPGWWGIYPTIISFTPEIASVICKKERNWIPFREPGLVFGGTVCYLTADKVGETWIKRGNIYSDELDNHESHVGRIKVIVTDQ
jgi:hypothetical protein